MITLLKLNLLNATDHVFYLKTHNDCIAFIKDVVKEFKQNVDITHDNLISLEEELDIRTLTNVNVNARFNVSIPIVPTCTTNANPFLTTSTSSSSTQINYPYISSTTMQVNNMVYNNIIHTYGGDSTKSDKIKIFYDCDDYGPMWPDAFEKYKIYLYQDLRGFLSKLNNKGNAYYYVNGNSYLKSDLINFFEEMIDKDTGVINE